MPEPPTPPVNGHVLSVPALHASRSMLSFAPAASTFGCAASTASAGSFCLFCENGPEGLPTLTRGSLPFAAPATATTDAASPAARAAKKPLRMNLPLRGVIRGDNAPGGADRNL